MKQKLLLSLALCLIIATSAWAQTATAPLQGDGSEMSPYQIASIDNLYWISQADTAWDAYYEQTANIDVSATSTWDSEAGFSPIGNNMQNKINLINGQVRRF